MRGPAQGDPSAAPSWQYGGGKPKRVLATPRSRDVGPLPPEVDEPFRAALVAIERDLGLPVEEIPTSSLFPTSGVTLDRDAGRLVRDRHGRGAVLPRPGVGRGAPGRLQRDLPIRDGERARVHPRPTTCGAASPIRATRPISTGSSATTASSSVRRTGTRGGSPDGTLPGIDRPAGRRGLQHGRVQPEWAPGAQRACRDVSNGMPVRARGHGPAVPRRPRAGVRRARGRASSRGRATAPGYEPFAIT